MNAGYYQNYSDAHAILQYRNTRGHNTVMINNIGQPFTTRAYGNITRALNGDNRLILQEMRRKPTVDRRRILIGLSVLPKRDFRRQLNMGLEIIR
ncbi:heparinase II/III-family protein [Bacteroides sp. BFG-551]|nr:heparinase II/III-family protein [Bacteroides sp. BFG-551]